ncbi:MAG: FAD-dependent oxidoreductase [Candidatus Hodarchaeota archaeon]
MSTSDEIIIIGAGLAGLSCGYELAKLGLQFKIYEKNENIGGLARTLWFETDHGQFGSDYGGHRFLTREKEIEEFFFKVVGPENIETRQRSSHILLKGKYFDYPIKPFSALFKMPFIVTIKAGITYWYAFIRYWLARRGTEDNFEDWVKHRFGSTLYNLFFRDYTRKAWGIDPKNISSIWAAERIKASSFFSIIKSSLFKPDPESKVAMTLYKQFYYPSTGIQVLSNNMAEFIKQNNQEIFTNAELQEVVIDKESIKRLKFKNGTETEHSGKVVSSIPIPNLIETMGTQIPDHIQKAAKRLKYRDLIVIGFMLNKPKAMDDSWIYFPEDQYIFVRASEPSKYGTSMSPPGKTSLVVEITCSKGDSKWEMPDKELIHLAKDQLISLGFFSKEEIITNFITRVTHAYPIFDLDYQKNISTVLTYLSQIKNLELIGRTGTFQYLNMDLVMLHGLNCARRIAGITDKSATKIDHNKKWVG